MRILSFQDEFLRWHLLDSGLCNGLVQVQLASCGNADTEQEFGGELEVLAIRWRTLVAPGSPLEEALPGLDWLQRKEVSGCLRNLAFCLDMLISVSRGAICLPWLVSASLDLVTFGLGVYWVSLAWFGSACFVVSVSFIFR